MHFGATQIKKRSLHMWRFFISACVCVQLINSTLVVAADSPSTIDGEHENVCNVINEYCIFSRSKGNCDSTVIQPYTCINQLKESDPSKSAQKPRKCEFLLDWHVNNEGIIKFSLTKYNHQLNQWIALIFSKNKQDENLYESDIVITLFPSNNQAKIIDGIIKDTDVLLNEYIDDLSEKKIFDEMLNITRNYADIKFSRRLEYKYETSTGATASSGVKFNQCTSSEDGFNIVYIQGKMDEKNNILFNTASAPIYIGPFCFKSCGLSDSMHNNDTSTKSSTPATTTVKTEPIFTKLLRNQDIMVQSKTGLSNKYFKADSIADSTSLPATSSTTLLTTTLATTPTTTQSTSTPTTTSTITSTTSSTTVTTTQSTIITTTSQTSTSQITSSQTTPTSTTPTQTSTTSTTTTTTSMSTNPTTFSTTLPLTSSSATTSVITTTVSTTVPVTLDPSHYCTIYGNMSTTYRVFYHLNTDFIILSASFSNLIEKFSINGNSSLRVGVFISYSFSSNLNLYWTEFNQTTLIQNLTNTNESATISSSTDINSDLNSTNIQIIIPRLLKLSNGVSMQDCFEFRFFFSNLTAIPLNQLVANYSQYSIFLGTTNTNCVRCSIAHATWDPNYLNLSSLQTSQLASSIQNMFSNQLISNSIYTLNNLTIISINQHNGNRNANIRRKYVRQVENQNPGILVNARIDVSTSNTDMFTKDVVTKSINALPSVKVDGSSLEPLPILTTTTTIKPQAVFDSDYQRRFAIALVLSLLATITVFGGALFAFEYWKKKRYNGGESSGNVSGAANRGMRLAVPNRQVRYENQTIQLDNFADGQRQTSDDANFEFNYNNAGFNRLDEFPNSVTNHNSANTYYTDFTGSREVGIDVGPFGGSETEKIIFKKSNQTPPELPPLPAPPKQFVAPSTNIKSDEPKPTHLVGIINESLVMEKSTISSKTTKKEPNEEENDDDDEINFSYFDIYKKGGAVNEKTQVADSELNAKIKKTTPEKDESKKRTELQEEPEDDDEKDDEVKTEDIQTVIEEDQEIHDIFSKDIEESLPELFGSYKSSTVNLNLAENVEKKLAPSMPNGLSKPKPVEIDVVRSRGALGFSSQDKIGHKIETETENDDYNEDAEDEEEEEEEESSSYSSFKNANKLDKLPKQAIKVTNVVDSTTDSAGNASTSSSDEYDYKSIDKNAFKKATSVAKLNDEQIIANGESFNVNGNHLNGNGGFYNGSVYKSESDYFFHNGIAEFATPRICKLIRDSSYDGLGIHLCDSKNHMIKAIEPQSPAELSGLKPGDKILYVNNENVENLSYSNVIEKLKQALNVSDELNLVVMNAIEYNIFKGKNKNNQQSNDTDEFEDSKIKLKTSQIGLQTSTTGATDGGGDESSKFDLIFGKPQESIGTTEFNPFDDITNEIYTPFLHYASIPPPTTESFKEDTVVDLNDLTTTYSHHSRPNGSDNFDLFEKTQIGGKNNNKMVNSSTFYDGSESESTSENVSSSIETNNNNNNNNNSNKAKHLVD